MKIKKLEKVPEDVYEGGKETEEVSFEGSGLDEVYYWYVSGFYDGTGEVIYRKGDKWGYHSMCHCSCYGPTCHADWNTPYSSAREILEKATDYFRKEVEPLVVLSEQ